MEYSKILYSSKYDIQGKPDYIFKSKIKNDMVPVEIKSGMINDENMPHKGDLMQLTAYFIIVKEIYGVKPKYGYIMYKDFMFKIKNTYTLRKQLIKTLKMMRGMLKGNNINVDANFVTCRYVCAMEQYVSFVNLKKEKGNMMTNTIPVEKNKDYRVKIEDLSRDGVGVCKVENFTIFVADSAIGDVCDIKILKVKKNYAFGKIIKIIEPSKDRVEPICEFSKRCGGCQLQHLSYQSQLEFKTKKVKECLERLGGFENVDVLPTIGAKSVLNYRNKCQFPVGMGERWGFKYRVLLCKKPQYS